MHLFSIALVVFAALLLGAFFFATRGDRVVALGRYRLHRKFQDDRGVRPLLCVFRSYERPSDDEDPAPVVGTERVACLWRDGRVFGFSRLEPAPPAGCAQAQRVWVWIPLGAFLLALAGCAGVTQGAVSADARTCSDVVGSPVAVSAERFACDEMGALFGSSAGDVCATAVTGLGLLCSDVAVIAAQVPVSTPSSVASPAVDYRGRAMAAIRAR